MLGAFHLFPQLPAELRDEIWKCSITPRLVPLIVTTDSAPLSSRQHIYTITPLPCPIPLHICHESRVVALQHYSREFPTNVDWDSGILGSEPQVWFNYDHDIAWLEAGNGNARTSRKAPDRLATLLSAQSRAKIKHMAVGSDWQTLAYEKYPKVETFTIVFGKMEHVSSSRSLKSNYSASKWTTKEWEYEDAVHEERFRTPITFHELNWQNAMHLGFVSHVPRIRVVEIVWRGDT